MITVAKLAKKYQMANILLLFFMLNINIFIFEIKTKDTNHNLLKFP